MRRNRFVISDDHWSLIEPLFSGKASDCGVTAKGNRLFLEAVLWRVRVAAHGATCRRGLTIGTAVSGASAGGRRAGCLIEFLKLYPAILILNTP